MGGSGGEWGGSGGGGCLYTIYSAPKRYYNNIIWASPLTILSLRGTKRINKTIYTILMSNNVGLLEMVPLLFDKKKNIY